MIVHEPSGLANSFACCALTPGSATSPDRSMSGVTPRLAL